MTSTCGVKTACRVSVFALGLRRWAVLACTTKPICLVCSTSTDLITAIGRKTLVMIIASVVEGKTSRHVSIAHKHLWCMHQWAVARSCDIQPSSTLFSDWRRVKGRQCFPWKLPSQCSPDTQIRFGIWGICKSGMLLLCSVSKRTGLT